MGWHNSLFFWLYTTKSWKQLRQMTADLLMYNNYLMHLDLDAVSFYCCFYCKSMGGWRQAGECQLVWQVFWQAQLLKHMNLQRAPSHFQKRNIAFRVHLNVNIRTKQKLCLILSKGTVWHYGKGLLTASRVSAGWYWSGCFQSATVFRLHISHTRQTRFDCLLRLYWSQNQPSCFTSFI